MDPRRGGRARLPRQRDALPALDRLATLDEQRRGVAVYRHPTVAVLEDHEPAERRDAGAGIGHDAIGGRRDGRADGGSDLAAVAALAVAPRTEIGRGSVRERGCQTFWIGGVA